MQVLRFNLNKIAKWFIELIIKSIKNTIFFYYQYLIVKHNNKIGKSGDDYE